MATKVTAATLGTQSTSTEIPQQKAGAVEIPPEWVIKYSKSRGGKTYYYNTITGVSTWRMPEIQAVAKAASKKKQESSANEPQKATKRQAPKDEQSLAEAASPVPQKKLRNARIPKTPDFSHLSPAERDIVIGFSPNKKRTPTKVGDCDGQNTVQVAPVMALSAKLKATSTNIHAQESRSRRPKKTGRRRNRTNSAPKAVNDMPQVLGILSGEKTNMKTVAPSKERDTTALNAGSTDHSSMSHEAVTHIKVLSTGVAANSEKSEGNDIKTGKKKRSKRKKKKSNIKEDKSLLPVKFNKSVPISVLQGQATTKTQTTLLPPSTSDLNQNLITSTTTSSIPPASVKTMPTTSTCDEKICLPNFSEERVLRSHTEPERSSSPVDNESSSVFSKTDSDGAKQISTFAGSELVISRKESPSFISKKCISPLLREDPSVNIGDKKLPEDSMFTFSAINRISGAQTAHSSQSSGSDIFQSNKGDKFFEGSSSLSVSPVFNGFQNNSYGAFPEMLVRSKFGQANLTNSPVGGDSNSNKFNYFGNFPGCTTNMNDNNLSRFTSNLSKFENAGEIANLDSQSSRSSPNFFQDSFSGETQEKQDIEDMEVDEEGIQILSNLQDVRVQTAGLLQEPGGVLTETVTKNDVWKTPVDVTDGKALKTQKLVLVIDTNVLISCLRFLRDLHSNNIPGHGKPLLILPWAVMQELDFLKNGKGCTNDFSNATSQRAVEAVRFIHSQLVAKSPNLVGQTPQEAREKADLLLECNDDKILQCCLQCAKKYESSWVILLTRDINLTNKALIMGIQVASNETLWSQLKVTKPVFDNKQQQVQNKSVIKGLSKSVLLKSAEINSQPGVTVKNSSDKQQQVIPSLLNFSMEPSKQLSRPIAKPPYALPMLHENITTPAAEDKQGFSKDSSDKQQQVIPSLLNFSMEPNKQLSQPIAKLPYAFPRLQENITTPANKDKQGSSKEQLNREHSREDELIVFNKFQSVWALIFEMKSQVSDILTIGKSHAHYTEAVEMLQRVQLLLQQLKEKFDKCLNLSPVIIWDHQNDFDMLCSDLNTFFTLAQVPKTDHSQAVRPAQLMAHFCTTKNRPTLSNGLEQLTSFISDFAAMSRQHL